MKRNRKFDKMRPRKDEVETRSAGWTATAHAASVNAIAKNARQRDKRKEEARWKILNGPVRVRKMEDLQNVG